RRQPGAEIAHQLAPAFPCDDRDLSPSAAIGVADQAGHRVERRGVHGIHRSAREPLQPDALEAAGAAVPRGRALVIQPLRFVPGGWLSLEGELRLARMLHHLLLVYLLAGAPAIAAPAQAPESRLAFPPAAGDITVVSDVEYATDGSTRLAMDVYKPKVASGARVPGLIFFNRATGADRSGRFFPARARAARANGSAAI